MHYFLNKQWLLLFVLATWLPISATAQTDTLYNPSQYNGLSWQAFVQQAEENMGVQIFYHPDSVPQEPVTLVNRPMPLQKHLEALLAESPLTVSYDGQRHYFIISQKSIQPHLPAAFFQFDELAAEDSAAAAGQGNEQQLSYVSNTRTVGSLSADDKPTAQVSGYIRNATNNNPIVGATLLVKETGQSTITDYNGFYSLRLRKGTYTFEIRSAESKTSIYQVEVLSDGQLDLYPERKEIALDEVVVTSEKFHNVRSTQMGFEKLTAKNVQEIPIAFGEADIVKVSLLLPGIQTVGEGASGFNVRGSPVDQNIFYINQVPVYNTSHFLGFFSAFNSEAINDFTLYKSSIPAQYGGRLASVFDIKSKKGNKREFSMSGGISPVTANVLVEGPVVKNKLSYMAGVRSTYSNWLFEVINNKEIQDSKARFGDIVANLSWQMNNKNTLDAFIYGSTDDISLAGNNEYNYQNLGTSLSWGHVIGQKHSIRNSLIYSRYQFTERNLEQALTAYELPYALNHTEWRTHLEWRQWENHDIQLGLDAVYYAIDQGKILPYGQESVISPATLANEQALEAGLYLSDTWNPLPRLSLTLGLRVNNYSYLGPNKVYQYGSDDIRAVDNITDTLSYNPLQAITSDFYPDFRLVANYMVNRNFSIKGGVSQLHQHIFMLSNTIAASPTFKWKLSDAHIESLSGIQYALGVYTNLFDEQYEISAEAYFKDISQFVDYKDGADLALSTVPETELLQGNLDAYGVEFMLKKPFGKLNGWVNYTYSHSQVQVNNTLPALRINYGEPYNSSFDKPHAVNLVANYKFSRRFSVSSNLVYSTGRPVTYPAAIYYQDDREIVHYTKRNEYRIPDYFRIDLAIKVEGSLKKEKLLHGTWQASVYNLTGRRNAYSVFFKTEEGDVKGYKMSIFAVPVFSLSYNFKLGNYADKYY